MTCTNNIKQIGETWKFFHKIRNEDGTFQNLNGYEWWFTLYGNGEVLDLQNGKIDIDGEELIINVSDTKTSTFPSGRIELQYKIIDTDQNTIISNKGFFYAESTLFQ